MGRFQAISYYKEKLSWHFFDTTSENAQLRTILTDPKYQQWIDSKDEQGRMIIGRCKDTEPISYWSYQPGDEQPHKLFDTRPKLSGAQLAPKQSISLKTRDGITIHGYLTMPQGVTNAPLIIKVHGAPGYVTLAILTQRYNFLPIEGMPALKSISWLNRIR